MRAVFLDRDGVINKHPGPGEYVTSVKGFRFLPGVKKAVAALRRKKYKIFVVSNQAGIAKGIYSRQALDAITQKMLKGIKASGGSIDAVFYCLHREEDACPCRKPKTGSLKEAKRLFPLIKMKDSFFVGDTMRDIRTARSGGCKSVLVLSGEEKLSNRQNWSLKPDFACKDLKAAVKLILSRK